MGIDSENFKMAFDEEEREILHDISNQLVIVQGMSGLVLKAMVRGQSMGDQEREKMEKVLAAAKNIAKIIQGRRNYLNSIAS